MDSQLRTETDPMRRLAMQFRSGIIPAAVVEVAATLGHPAAKMILPELLPLSDRWEDHLFRRNAISLLPRAHRIQFAANCAERVLPVYETQYPNNRRPRMQIEAARTGAQNLLVGKPVLLRTDDLSQFPEVNSQGIISYAGNAATAALAVYELMLGSAESIELVDSICHLSALAGSNPVGKMIRVDSEGWERERHPPISKYIKLRTFQRLLAEEHQCQKDEYLKSWESAWLNS